MKKKRNLKNIHLNKHLISVLNTIYIKGGKATPVRQGSEVSYCHVGSKVQCCA